MNNQFTTQNNQTQCNVSTKQAGLETPADPIQQQHDQFEPTTLQDTPLMRQISTLMDMMQGKLSALTNQVNNLVQYVAGQTLYTTVNETHVPDKSIDKTHVSNKSLDESHISAT